MPCCTSNLRDLRVKAGFSVNRLAREAGLDRATVSKAEKGTSVQDVTLAKMLRPLGRELGRELTFADVIAEENGDRSKP